jgi:5,6,7,8-tetrahydromethanopterin hydro-lyase
VLAPITTNAGGDSGMEGARGRLVAKRRHGILSARFAFPGARTFFSMMEILPMSMFIGEALCGDGNEIAHIDLLIGSKDGPVGVAFANALARQSEGHSNLLAVLTPNLAVKPATVMITKVTIKGMKQAVQMFGPAQAAVAKAVADSVAAGVIPKGDAEKLVIVCGVFIHPAAADDKKIHDYNYEATKLAIANAMKGSPSADEMIAGKDKAAHPFRGF